MRPGAQWETFDQVRSEIVPMLEQQQAEVGADYEPYDPDWGRYEELDRIGSLAVWIARSEQTIVGYVIWLILRGLHNVTTRFATADLIYLTPGWREGATGYVFVQDAIAAVEQRYRPNFVRIETNDLYENGRLGTILLQRLKFRRIGSVYQRART